MDLIDSSSRVISTGEKYGRYTVLSIHRAANGYQKYARVKCDCGSQERFVPTNALRSGDSKSCGCLHRERVTKHGLWGNPLHKVWRSMMDRCYNQNNKRYSRYGGRGITVCPKWHEAENFIADMKPTYSGGMTLDRINNNSVYSTDNCRWATRSQQNRNYSRNLMFKHDGEELCLADWAKASGINYGTLRDRIFIQKLSFHEAINKK